MPNPQHHDNILFSLPKKEPIFAVKVKNYDSASGAIGAGDVVCVWGLGGTWIRVSLSTYSSTYFAAAAKVGRHGKYRIFGVALEDIAFNASGVVCTAGHTTNVYIEGVFVGQSLLTLGAARGNAKVVAVTTSFGKGEVFGMALESGSGTTSKVFVFPWRI